MTLLSGLMLLSAIPAAADNDRAVTIDQLPAAAREFIAENFPGEQVAYAKLERDFPESRYEVVFTSARKLEFKRNGEWLKVEAKYRAVPEEIVPEQIAEYVRTHFPGVMVKEIAKERKEYEVELSNSLELKFDRKAFFLTDYDD